MKEVIVLDPNDSNVKEEVQIAIDYINSVMSLNKMFESERSRLISTLALQILTLEVRKHLTPGSGVLDSNENTH